MRQMFAHFCGLTHFGLMFGRSDDGCRMTDWMSILLLLKTYTGQLIVLVVFVTSIHLFQILKFSLCNVLRQRPSS